MIKVLFVCTGNICRSPTAEGVFRHMARAAGIGEKFLIDSAGTGAWHAGEPPDPRASRVAQRHGVSLDGQKARALEDSDYTEFDYIFAMDAGHLQEIGGRAPKGARAKIAMFLESGDVPDPWYGGEDGFERVFALVNAGASAILETMRKDHDI